MLVFRKLAEIGRTRSSTYNFWQSSRIEAQEIIEAHQKQTSHRASKEEIILAIQDTSDFNFTHHQSKTEEQGFGMTCASLICQRTKSSLNYGINNTRSTLGNFGATNMD